MTGFDRWLAVASLTGLVIGSLSCEDDACTERGCVDGVSVTLSVEGNRWPAGVYELDVAFDGEHHVCRFAAPAELPKALARRSVGCDPAVEGLVVELAPEYQCSDDPADDAGADGCGLIDGQYKLLVSAAGTPERMEVKLERGGELVAESEQTLQYQNVQPNGEGCDPICRVSTVEVSLQ